MMRPRNGISRRMTALQQFRHITLLTTSKPTTSVSLKCNSALPKFASPSASASAVARLNDVSTITTTAPTATATMMRMTRTTISKRSFATSSRVLSTAAVMEDDDDDEDYEDEYDHDAAITAAALWSKTHSHPNNNNNNIATSSISAPRRMTTNAAAAAAAAEEETTAAGVANISSAATRVDFKQSNNIPSSASVVAASQPQPSSKHCVTCTCEKGNDEKKKEEMNNNTVKEADVTIPPRPPLFLIDDNVEMDNFEKEDDDPMPPPLPEPKVTFRRRILPTNLVPFTSPAGHAALCRALQQNTAAPYAHLTAHFDNQSDPASCGVTTLRQVLNASHMDPTAVRWKGGWRYYASDAMVLCECFDPVRVARVGISVPQFARLATCHGLTVQVKRPPPVAIATDEATADDTTTIPPETTTTAGAPTTFTLDDFRTDVQTHLSTATHNWQHPTYMVVSFSRAALQQTGDGHFSTLAAYDTVTDSVLVLDVARFKYVPYWVKLTDLYAALQPLDSTATNLPRAWILVQQRRIQDKPQLQQQQQQQQNSTNGHTGQDLYSYIDQYGNICDEGECSAELVPPFNATTEATCPIRPIQIQYCEAAWKRRQRQ